ncbi:hypothetical protein D3C84_969270 [compost metagenome]
MITACTVAAVDNLQEVALGAVGIFAVVQRSLFLADGMGLQTSLFVVGVIAEQLALMALPFAPADKTMAGQACAVEVDGGEGSPFGAVVDKDTSVWQAQAREPATDVVVVTQGSPALMLGDQSVLKVVFEP